MKTIAFYKKEWNKVGSKWRYQVIECSYKHQVVGVILPLKVAMWAVAVPLWTLQHSLTCDLLKAL